MSQSDASCPANVLKSHTARGLQFLALGMVMTGCIVPPNLLEETEVGNHQPRIIRSETEPVPETEVPVSGVRQFRVTVEELDLDDEIHLKAFLDYDPENPSDAQAERASPGADETLRSMSFELDACQQQFPSTHRVTVIISDRVPIDSDEKSVFRFPEFAEGAETDSTFWVINCVETGLAGDSL